MFDTHPSRSAMKAAASRIDHVLACADNALRTLAGAYTASRRSPAPPNAATELDDEQRRLSGALMRVNHVGEVCAQALYNAQALATTDPSLQRRFEVAARDESDHLAWTHRRLRDLGERTSLLNPLWYAGAFGIGMLAGRFGPAASLGFLAETEHQVEQHLQNHLERLPRGDEASRAIVEQMKLDEARHAADARQAGATEMPMPVKLAMRLAAKVMTRTAHFV
jgi:ubiquinone biosynthesis monooxygenase Coq7